MEETNFSNQGPQQQGQNFNPQMGGQAPVPNSTAVLVLGIISIALCWCYGIVALICGIIALVLAGKGMAAYKASPESYRLASFNNLKAGKVCAIIGICLSALMIIYVIVVLSFVGATMSALPWEDLMKQ